MRIIGSCFDECFQISFIFIEFSQKFSTLSFEVLYLSRKNAPSSLKSCHVCLQISRLITFFLFIYNEKSEIINFVFRMMPKPSDETSELSSVCDDLRIFFLIFRKFHSKPQRKGSGRDEVV